MLLTAGDISGGRINPLGGYVPPSKGMPLGIFGKLGMTPGR